MSRQRTSFVLPVILVLAACSTADTNGGGPAEVVDTDNSGAGVHESFVPVPFGDERWGFAAAASANGRIVILRRFRGTDRPTFGQHGESSAESDVAVFDLIAGEERQIDRLVGMDWSQRWLLILDKTLWLVDGNSGRWEEIEDVDLESDANRCLPPRQANFSVDGTRAGWVSADGHEFIVRNLDNGEQWRLRTNERIWRGWPAAGRSAVLAEVLASDVGWPVQQTSCACLWCSRFALSQGFYGWSGPAFVFVQVNEDGTREPADSPPGGDSPEATDTGCRLEAAYSDDSGLEKGPWHWTCE